MAHDLAVDPVIDLDLAIDPTIDPPLLTVDSVDRGMSRGDRSIDLATHCDRYRYRSGYRSWPSIWLSISIAYTICDPILRLMLAIGIHRTLNNMVFSQFLNVFPNDWPLFTLWLDSLDSDLG